MNSQTATALTAALEKASIPVDIYSTNAGYCTLDKSVNQLAGLNSKRSASIKRPQMLLPPTLRRLRSRVPLDAMRASPFLATNTHHSHAFSNSHITELEYSVHATNAKMHEELERVFPFEDLSKEKRKEIITRINIVITFQRCRNDLVGIGPEVEQEKDERLETVSNLIPCPSGSVD
jgi:hypothetical protein